jgi:type I restriction enzyme, S subunit
LDLVRNEIQKTSGQQNLTIETCKQIPVLLPPLSEQRRIAEILSTWDQAIAVQERLVANARAQKKALMQTLLTGTKKRLPGFKGEWKMKLFKHVVSIDQDSLGQNTPPDFEFRYISLSDVSSGSIANNLPSHTFSEAPSRARRKLKLGDILMATVRPNLQAFARVQSAQSDCIASTGFSVLSAKRDYSAGYVYHYLFSEHITGQIDALVVGSSYPAINSADVANLAIHCPEIAEQDAIAQVLNASDETIISGETKFSILKREKSALMQQLLTGKRRVKVEAIEQ